MAGSRARGALVLLVLLSGLAGPARAGEGPAPAWIQLYQAFATPVVAVVHGRVHRGAPPPPPRKHASLEERLGENAHLLRQDGIPQLEVVIELAGSVRQSHRALTDEHGYFYLKLPAAEGAGRQALVRLGSPGYEAAPVQAPVPPLAAGPGLAVVTDIDDTILDTRVKQQARMIFKTIVSSGHELRAVPGAAKVLGELCAPGQDRPLFYLSGSPWQLYDRLQLFFELGDFPKGILMLKRFSREPLKDQLAYKYPHLVFLFDALPERRFILFGDTGESDPEVYARISRERPGRVAAILIHRVTAEDPAAPRFSGQFVFDDFQAARRHLQEIGGLGLLPASAAPSPAPAAPSPAR